MGDFAWLPAGTGTGAGAGIEQAADGACLQLKTTSPDAPSPSSAHGRRSGICIANRRDQAAERRDWRIASSTVAGRHET
jgi:hypothetical protein